MIMRKCGACGRYTLAGECPACGAAVKSAEPPKFSPQDRYGKYRRMMKQECEKWMT